LKGVGQKANSGAAFRVTRRVSDLNGKWPFALAFRGSPPRSRAARTQIWIAISVYVLVAIIKKRLRLDVSLHTLLQILSLTLFEKLPLKQAVAGVEPTTNNPTFHSQLNLFEF
jgi:hypothetical protein